MRQLLTSPPFVQVRELRPRRVKSSADVTQQVRAELGYYSLSGGLTVDKANIPLPTFI